MWTADFGAAVAFASDMERGFKRIAAGELQDAISAPMADLGKQQLLATFRASIEPSGRPFAPLKVRIGGRPLVLTGAMMNSANCKVGPKDDAAGFDLTYLVTDEKAPWHQSGTRRGGGSRKSGRGRGASPERQHIPPRKMLFENASEATRWQSQQLALAALKGEHWMVNTFRRV